MNKARKKFVWYAEFVVFVLLAILLSVINAVNFTMAAEDADMITKMIASEHGSFNTDKTPGQDGNVPPVAQNSFRGGKRFGDFGGPDSPEVNYSIRYFTYAFDKDGNAEKVVFKMSAVTEDEAQQWAESLKNESLGWTKVNYRYRVYEDDGKTYVTVIDQGRELLTSYRILIISVCGGAVMLLLSLVILILVGKKLFKPLEESDRKQKQFIANVESEFKLPLTVINANTEIMEKENGPSECTNIINKQVRRMTVLVKDLASLAIFNEKDISVSKINLSDIISNALDSSKAKFAEKGITLSLDIEPDIVISGDEGVIKKALRELIGNSLKFTESEAAFALKKHNDRITLKQTNDTKLKNGTIDQIFDRFTVLENADGHDGIGLGLSYVKDAALAHNGRVGAKVSEGIFTLKIDL